MHHNPIDSRLDHPSFLLGFFSDYESKAEALDLQSLTRDCLHHESEKKLVVIPEIDLNPLLVYFFVFTRAILDLARS